MVRVRGSVGLFVLVLGLLAPGLAVSAVGSAWVHTPTPHPGAVVDTGSTPFTAWLSSDADVASVEVTLDDRPVAPTTLGAPHADRGRPVSATLDLSAGRHTLAVRFTTTDGAEAQRSWELVASTLRVERVAGTDRFATAVALSRHAYPLDRLARAAVLARGDEFADALAGAPLAASVDGPLLLTTAEALPATTRDELDRVLAQGATVHVLGGPGAISDTVAHEIDAMGFEVRRHEGASRFETAAAIARTLPSTEHAFVVSATAYADALSGSVPAARDGSPILLTASDDVPAATVRALEDLGTTRVTIIGGASVASQDVEDELRALVPTVERIAGADRAATAARVAEAFFPAPSDVGTATGWGYADALSGAPVLAAEGRPLLLTAPSWLPASSADVVRTGPASSALVLGGTSVVASDAVVELRAASVEQQDAPHLTSTSPAPGDRATYLPSVGLQADRPLATGSSLYVTIGGWEVAVESNVEGSRLTAALDTTDLTVEVDHEVLVAATLVSGDATSQRRWRSTYRPVDPHFADAGPVALHLPSRHVELVGFHQSNHDGAQQMGPRSTSTATMTMESRGRGTGLRTAADIVADPALPVYAPATGTVIRAGSYRLYCDHTDHYLVIEPDARPGWEVKVLHFEGLAVSTGDRVVAGVTRIGSAPRTLPFASQVDEHSGPDDWPHVHVEVVDPSVPDRPGSGC